MRKSWLTNLEVDLQFIVDSVVDLTRKPLAERYSNEAEDPTAVCRRDHQYCAGFPMGQRI
jgi:hypothetical protein